MTNVTDDNEFVTVKRCPFPQSLSRDALFTGLNPLVKWLNLHIHMHAATHETVCICLSNSVAAVVDMQTGCPLPQGQ